MNFSIVIFLSEMGEADDSRNAAACQMPQRWNATVCLPGDLAALFFKVRTAWPMGTPKMLSISA